MLNIGIDLSKIQTHEVCFSFTELGSAKLAEVPKYRTTRKACPLERGVLPKASFIIAIPSKEGWQAEPDGCMRF